jgi:hypothetical protein
MKVDDAVEALVLVLGVNPVADGPEVVPDVSRTRRLNAAEGPLPAAISNVLVQG